MNIAILYDFSKAAALSVMMSAVLIVISVLYNILTKKRMHMKINSYRNKKDGAVRSYDMKNPKTGLSVQVFISVVLFWR